MTDIRTFLKENDVLLFDGGMGTFYAQRNRTSHQACEMANLTAPEEVEAIHRLYCAAGAQAIKTNTFNVNRAMFSPEHCREMIRAGWEIARRAAEDDTLVFADIGPLEESVNLDAAEEYKFVADCFLPLGTKYFLFESVGNPRGVAEAARYIRNLQPKAFILVSFAVQPDGFTRDGHSAAELLQWGDGCDDIDALGLNCVLSAYHMVQLAKRLPRLHKPLSCMPNAGYPTVRANRIFYDGGAPYFAEQAAQLVQYGVSIFGGCCGTTPEHIAALGRLLHLPNLKRITYTAPAEQRRQAPCRPDAFWDALCDSNRKPIAVELDPPALAETDKFMAGAAELQRAGADLITIADCPIARPRMDSSLLACKLKRELGVNAMPHMTCRDRNRNAAQALLLGLSAEDIHHVLIVTGDPLPSQRRDEVRSVYHFNSRKLIAYVDSLGREVLDASFHIFAALNLNAASFDIQLELAKEKERNGAQGFFTQPVLTERALENLKRARAQLNGKLLGGIMPIVSHKNALFLSSEVAGVAVDESIVQRYEGADRARGEELAVEISTQAAEDMAPYVDGFYLMTPFGRTGLMARIMDELRARGLTGAALQRQIPTCSGTDPDAV